MPKLQVASKIDTRGLAKSIADLKEFSENKGVFWINAQRQIGQMFVNRVQSFIKANHSRSGTLEHSITFRITDDGVEIYSNPNDPGFHGVNKSGTPIQYYAPWVEEGTKGIRGRIYPNKAKALKFYDPYESTTPTFRKSVRKQKGIHFMRDTSNDLDAIRAAQDILVSFAIECVAYDEYRKNYKNKRNNARGWHFSKEGSKRWEQAHGRSVRNKKKNVRR